MSDTPQPMELSYVAVSHNADDIVVLSIGASAEYSCFRHYACLLEKGIPQTMWIHHQMVQNGDTLRQVVCSSEETSQHPVCSSEETSSNISESQRMFKKHKHIRSKEAKIRRRKLWRQKSFKSNVKDNNNM